MSASPSRPGDSTAGLPPEMPQLTLAVEHSREHPPIRSAVFFWWGLILAKSLLVEWAVQRFAVPFHGAYVWGTTLVIAAAATGMFLSVAPADNVHKPVASRFVTAIWVAAVAAVLLLCGAAALLPLFSPYLLPALASVILGVAFYIHSVLDHRHVLKLAAAGWWVGGALLFLVPTVDALAWMALLMLLFFAGPAFGFWWAGRTARA